MRILVADDDKHLREGLATLLKNDGYECLTAVDGVDALTIYHSKKPDLCILDIMMPRMDGMQLCHLLRVKAPNMPILLLTALDKEIDQVKGLDLGADDYISKPFNSQTLLARVRALLRRNMRLKIREPELLSYNKLLINTGKMIASFEGNEVSLTQREQTFLLYMLKNTQQTLSRNQIFDHCWNTEYSPNSRTLDQFVSTVRQKMEKTLGTPRFITTVYGIGYKSDTQFLESKEQ